MRYPANVWLGAGLEVFLGWACAGCGRPGARLCAECRLNLGEEAYPVFREGCPGPIFATTRFAGSSRQLVTAFKERDAWHLAGPLGGRLGVAAEASLAALSQPRLETLTAVVLVPVPSSARTVRARGHDVTALLGSGAAAYLAREGTSARGVRALRQRKGVVDQSGLSAAARRTNAFGGFVLTRLGERELRRRTCGGGTAVLLVDDIVTTGSTLTGAAQALIERGIGVDGFAVIAETP